MAQDKDSKQNVGRMTVFDTFIAGVVGIGAGTGTFIAPIREELTEVLERALGFREIKQHWGVQRAYITRDGKPIHVDAQGNIVQVDADGKILNADRSPTTEKGKMVTGRILRHDSVEGGTIRDENGHIVHVNHRNEIVAVDEHGMVLHEGKPSSEKARKLQVTSPAEEETFEHFCDRLHGWWRWEDKEWQKLVFREEGVEMGEGIGKFLKGSHQAWRAIRGDKQMGIMFKAVVSTAVAGGGMLMFLGSHHQRAKLSELSDKLDAMDTRQQQQASRQ